MASHPRAGGALERAAPLLFVLLWSSSFIAAKVGLRLISPLLFVAIRLVLAAAVLTALALARGGFRGMRGHLIHCAIAGILLNALLLMTAHVAMTHIAAAPIALVQTLNPLLTAILAIPLLRERLSRGQWLGLALGLAGVVLVVGRAALSSRVEFSGLMLTALGVAGMTGGTLYYGRFCRGAPLLAGTAVQFLAAAAFALLGMAIFETPHADWTGPAVVAVVWNTAAVSLGGMALYVLMLARGTAARAAGNFYLVPGTAGLLAWALLGEGLALPTLAGLAISALGCWLLGRRDKASGGAIGGD